MSPDHRSSPIGVGNLLTLRTLAIVLTVAGAVTMSVSIARMVRGRWPEKRPQVTYVAFRDACGHVPDELKGVATEHLAARWPAWIASHDAQTRARVAKGEEDSLANFLLYGTSFSDEPRITNGYRAALVRKLGSEQDADRKVTAVATARAIDLANALAEPGEDERRLTMSEIATRSVPVRGAHTQEEKERLAQYLFDNVVRFLNENRGYAMAIDGANAPDSLSTLYRTRGLSGDTSLLADYAIDRALQEIKDAAWLEPGSVRTVGVVGPGLDLIDKQGGYDWYPPQTTQPLVLMDTLDREGLANSDALQVLTFDISDRTNRYLERAVQRARDDQAYTVHLVRDDAWEWTPDVIRFWEACGNRIGEVMASTSVSPPEGVVCRAFRARPEWVRRLRPVDLNIVCQRLVFPDAERLDLLIATNVLCYYDSWQQRLALCNVASMLRPGGILLSTELLAESEGTGMQRVGSTTVRTSRTGGFVIQWYRRGR